MYVPLKLIPIYFILFFSLFIVKQGNRAGLLAFGGLNQNSFYELFDFKYFDIRGIVDRIIHVPVAVKSDL